MDGILDHVANRAVTWSETADQIKKRLNFVRWLVFVLSIAGALVAAIASQLPAGVTSESSIHAILAAFGTVLLAASAFIANRLLRDSEVQAWVRARAASEALKREAFRYAAQARPYDDIGAADQKLDTERAKIENNLNDLADRLAE